MLTLNGGLGLDSMHDIDIENFLPSIAGQRLFGVQDGSLMACSLQHTPLDGQFMI